MELGTFCGLTEEKPDFEENCPDFELDETLKEEYRGIELKPNEKRAKAVILFIWLVLILDVLAVVSWVTRLILLLKISHGHKIIEIVALFSDLNIKIIGILSFLVFFISGILFLMWFFRSYSNLHQLKRKLSYRRGWAIAGWFVPIVSWYMPYQIMKELYVESKKILLKKGKINNEDLSTKYLGYWWALWLIYSTFSQISTRFSLNAQTLEKSIIAADLIIINHIIAIALALITIKVVKDYVKVEPLLRD